MGQKVAFTLLHCYKFKLFLKNVNKFINGFHIKKYLKRGKYE